MRDARLGSWKLIAIAYLLCAKLRHLPRDPWAEPNAAWSAPFHRKRDGAQHKTRRVARKGSGNGVSIRFSSCFLCEELQNKAATKDKNHVVILSRDILRKKAIHDIQVIWM